MEITDEDREYFIDRFCHSITDWFGESVANRRVPKNYFTRKF